MERWSTANDVVIRCMREEDIPEILALDKQFVGEGRALTYSDPVESYIGGSLALSQVAEVQGRIAGFLLCRLAEYQPGEPEGVWIQLLGVHPDYQRRGIGQRLVRHLMEQCRETGLREMTVLANRYDDVLRAFFTSLGFRQGELVSYSRKVET